MAARNPRAGIEVGLNDRPAVEGLKRLAKSFGDHALRINQAAELASKAWGALTAVVGRVNDVVAESVQLAMEQERVERRAIAAIQAKVDLTQAEYDALQAANAERQRALGIGDEVQLQLQGTLAALGVQKQRLSEATEATIGLAEVTGQGLSEAARVVGKTLAGNVTALREYGIRATSVADASRQMAEMFRVAQAQSDSLRVRLSVLEAAWGDMQEVLGSAVTRSGAAADMLRAATRAVEDLTRYLDSDEGRGAVDRFFRLFASLAAMTVDSLEDLRVTTRAIFFGIGESLADAMHGSVRAAAQPVSALRRLAADLATIGAAQTEVRPGAARAGGGAGGGAGGAGGRAGGGIELGEIEFLGTEREARFREEWAVMEGLKTALAEQSQANARERQEIEAQLAREALDRRNELHMQAALMGLETTRTLQTAELEQLVAHHQAIQDAERRQAETLDSLGGRSVQVFGDQLSQMVVAAASGEQSITEALGGFVRGLLTQMGTMLISTGMAALALQALSFIPGLWGVTGPPGLGVGAALAAIGLGSALVAGSSFMSGGARAPGGGGGGSGGMARTPQAPRAPRMEDVVPRGFGAFALGDQQPYTVNIQFSGVVGDDRRAARMIEDVLRRGR